MYAGDTDFNIKIFIVIKNQQKFVIFGAVKPYDTITAAGCVFGNKGDYVVLVRAVIVFGIGSESCNRIKRQLEICMQNIETFCVCEDFIFCKKLMNKSVDNYTVVHKQTSLILCVKIHLSR